MDKTLKEMLHKSLTQIKGLYGGPCSKKEVENAEKDLRCSFSKGYKWFLLTYGSGIFEGYIVHGLRKTLMMSDNNWSVVDRTNFYKNTQNWPGIEDWYIISDDGSGNPIGCKPDGSVWLSDHDAGFEQIKLADTFEEFLYKLLTETLYE